MRAWLLQDFTGLSALRMADLPDPAAGNCEVVLQLDYAALNPADRYLAENQYPAKPPLPHILGRDGVGKIIAIGSGVHQYQVGQRVLILRGDTGVARAGTFARQVAVDIASIAEVPEGWSIEESAGASLVYLTAHQALTQWGTLEPGIVLISGASGGVGVASVQLAKAMGHRVVALSRDQGKREILRKIGAEVCMDPQNPNWTKDLKAKLHPHRVNLAIDNIGGSEFTSLLDTLGANGRVSVVGRLAGPVPNFNTGSLFFRRLQIGGVAVGTYTAPQAQSAWKEVVEMLKSTGAKPLVDSVFPFEQLLAAFDRLAKGPMGKVLLRPASNG